MPAPITSGLVTLLQDQLGDGYKVWDGEIPRWDDEGARIDLPAGTAVYRLLMPEEGFGRDNETFENSYGDDGQMLLEVYGTTRTQVETALTDVEDILLLQENWRQVNLGVSFELRMILVNRWGCKQIEQARTKDDNYVYRGFFDLTVGVNGTVRTR